MKIKIKDSAGNEWEEGYENEMTDVEISNMFSNFNKTRRPGELERFLVSVIRDVKNKNRKHTWEKTNLFTMFRGKASYDTYRCSVCGITGKRYSLDYDIRLDSKYRYKKYRSCRERDIE